MTSVSVTLIKILRSREINLLNDIWSKQFMILYVHNVNGFIYESKNQVRNDKTEILLKVALNIIKQKPPEKSHP
jgi:hypothetical protein